MLTTYYQTCQLSQIFRGSDEIDVRLMAIHGAAQRAETFSISSCHERISANDSTYDRVSSFSLVTDRMFLYNPELEPEFWALLNLYYITCKFVTKANLFCLLILKYNYFGPKMASESISVHLIFYLHVPRPS